MRLFGTERRACAFIAAVALLALLLAACTGHGSGTETDGPDGTEPGSPRTLSPHPSLRDTNSSVPRIAAASSARLLSRFTRALIKLRELLPKRATIFTARAFPSLR